MADPKQMTKTTETHTTITQTQGNQSNPLSAPAPATDSTPIVNTLAAEWVAGTTARVQGEVTPHRAATQYWFEYGTTPNLGEVTVFLSAGEGSDMLPVSAILSHLDHTATLYFRLVAENKNGKVSGAVHTLQATHEKKAVTVIEEKRPSRLYNILGTIGLVIVLIVIIWGLFHLATLLSPWFSSLFRSSSSQTPAALHVSAPASATSGTPMTVTWSYNTTAKGTYAFLYPCNDSLRFTTAGAAGTENAIPCGTTFGVTGSSLTMTPVLSGTKALNEPLTVIFAPATGAQVQGSAVVTISPEAQPVPVPVVHKPVTYTGPADLSVVILSAVVDQSGLATVVFDISNNGRGGSGSYTFQAYLPTRSTYTYYSPAQASLSPGSHIVNTLRFTDATPGAISIIVDPSESVNDSNRTNNYAAQNLSMPYGYNPQPQYNTNGYTPIYYGQQPYVY